MSACAWEQRVSPLLRGAAYVTTAGNQSCQPPPTNEEKYDETKKLSGQKVDKTVESKRHIAARSARQD